MLTSKPFKPEPWMFREAKTLVKNGHEVTVVGWDRDLGFKRLEFLEGIRVERFQLRGSYGSFLGLLPLFPIFYLLLFKRLLFCEFDVIEAHNFDTLPVAVILAKIKGKRVVYHSLDFYFTFFNRESKSKLKAGFSRFFWWLERFFLKCIDHLIVTTPAFFEQYKKFCSHCGCTILMNLPESNFFSKKKVSKVIDKGFTIAYIGEVRYEKPMLNLIECVKDLKDVNVLIVGGGVKSNSIREKVKHLDFVHLFDEIPFTEVVDFYHDADCINALYDSSNLNIRCAMPVKVLEAMACGKPVLANKNCWSSDFVLNHQLGFCVDENNIEEIRSAVLRLKNNVDLSRCFGSNGKRLIEKQYNWEKQEKDLLDVYGRLK